MFSSDSVIPEIDSDDYEEEEEEDNIVTEGNSLGQFERTSSGHFGGLLMGKHFVQSHESLTDWRNLQEENYVFGEGTSLSAGRKKATFVNDSRSTQIQSFTRQKRTSKFRYRRREVWKHIRDRFLRFIRLGGMAQRISEKTGIARIEVVKNGGSEFQDHNSTRGNEGLQAAHVVAARISEELSSHDRYYGELKNFLGHTQNVPKYANESPGIGHKIDKIQSERLKELATIDFSRDLQNNGQMVLIGILKEFLSALNEADPRDREQQYQYEKAKEVLKNIDIEKVFLNEGVGGYKGKRGRRYIPKKYREGQ